MKATLLLVLLWVVPATAQTRPEVVQQWQAGRLYEADQAALAWHSVDGFGADCWRVQLAIERGDFDLAQSLIQSLEPVAPSQTEASDRSEFALARGLVCEHRGFSQRAQQNYEQALTTASCPDQRWRALGGLERLQKQDRQADEPFAQAWLLWSRALRSDSSDDFLAAAQAFEQSGCPLRQALALSFASKRTQDLDQKLSQRAQAGATFRATGQEWAAVRMVKNPIGWSTGLSDAQLARECQAQLVWIQRQRERGLVLATLAYYQRKDADFKPVFDHLKAHPDPWLAMFVLTTAARYNQDGCCALLEQAQQTAKAQGYWLWRETSREVASYPEATVNLGDALALTQPDRALSLYEEAILAEPDGESSFYRARQMHRILTVHWRRRDANRVRQTLLRLTTEPGASWTWVVSEFKQGPASFMPYNRLGGAEALDLMPLRGSFEESMWRQLLQNPAIDEALFKHGQSLLARLNQPGLSSSSLTGALDALTELALARGDVLAAEGYARRVLATPKPFPAYLANAHWNLARIAASRGQWEDCKSQLLRRIELNSPDVPHWKTYCLHCLAGVERLQGHPEKAWDLLQQSATMPTLPFLESTLQAERALTLETLQRYPEAVLAAQKCVEATHKDRDKRPGLPRALALLARCRLAAGQSQAALSSYAEAHQLMEECCNLGGLLEVGLARLRLLHGPAALAASQQTLDSCLKIAPLADWSLAGPELSGQVESLIEKHLHLLEGAGQQRQIPQFLQRTQPLRNLRRPGLARLGPLQLQQTRVRGLQELAAAADPQQKAQLDEQLLVGRSEFVSAMHQLSAQNSDLESLVTFRIQDLVSLQKQLGQDEVLLQYFPGRERLYLFAVTSKGYAVESRPVGRTELYAQARTYRKTLTQGQFLSQTLIQPFASLLRGKKVYVVPAGELWYLPFESLPNASGGFLQEDVEISYLASPQLHHHQTRGQLLRSVLALGDPGGVDLPGTRLELAALRRSLPGAVIHSGAQATFANLKNEIAHASIVHLATHSVLDPNNLERSYLQLADGKLRLQQIYDLELAPNSLVILSCCESALGQAEPGAERVSLATGFTLAGASAVIASLWKVDDQATAALFTAFYAHLADGDSVSSALRKAKRELARRTPDPQTWAAFVLVGSP